MFSVSLWPNLFTLLQSQYCNGSLSNTESISLEHLTWLSHRHLELNNINIITVILLTSLILENKTNSDPTIQDGKGALLGKTPLYSFTDALAMVASDSLICPCPCNYLWMLPARWKHWINCRLVFIYYQQPTEIQPSIFMSPVSSDSTTNWNIWKMLHLY